MTDTFTHALLDFNNEIIKKFRWSNNQYKWYIEARPNSNIIKLAKAKQESTYQQMLKEVGECLF